MSKADGWKKIDAHEWRKEVNGLRMVIDKVIGNSGTPFIWRVYSLFRDSNGPTGKRNTIANGYAKRLCDAKARAEATQ